MARHYPKKITTSTVGLNVETCEKIADDYGKEKPVSVIRIYGRLKTYVHSTGQYGTFIKFSAADFIEAQNLITGDYYRAKLLIVPPGAEMVLQELVDLAKKTDSEAVVEFGLDITVQYYKSQNEKGTKFTWGVLPLREPTDDDSITALGKSFGNPPLLLPKKKK